MSLKAQRLCPVPKETVRVARAAYPKGNIYRDEDFADLSPKDGQPAEAPWRLALHLHEEWVERYEHRVEEYRMPDGKQARQDYALVVGKDGNSPC
jgi:hypothetical protein